MFVIDRATFFNLVIAGWIADGRGGGLVIGRSHNDDHIYMISQFSDNGFSFVGIMESWEFIVNYSASQNAKDRVQEINSFNIQHEPILSVPISARARLINTYAEPHDKFKLTPLPR